MTTTPAHGADLATDELKSLLTAAANASFDCGAHDCDDDDNPDVVPYEELARIANEKREAVLDFFRTALAAVPASEPVAHEREVALADRDEVPYMIMFDDQDQENEMVIGHTRARYRFKQISGSWNARLFAQIATNSRDDKTPCYAAAPAPMVPSLMRVPDAAPAPVSGMPDLASLLEELRDEYRSVVNSAYCQCDSDDDLLDRVSAALTTDTTNPTGETK